MANANSKGVKFSRIQLNIKNDPEEIFPQENIKEHTIIVEPDSKQQLVEEAALPEKNLKFSNESSLGKAKYWGNSTLSSILSDSESDPDPESESDSGSNLQQPEQVENAAYEKMLTVEEFAENVKKITELPNLSELSLTTLNDNGFLSDAESDTVTTYNKYPMATAPSEEQSEGINSYTDSFVETDSTLSVAEDDELLKFIQELDGVNDELTMETPTAPAKTEGEQEMNDFLDIAIQVSDAESKRLTERKLHEAEIENTKLIITDFLRLIIDHVVKIENLNDPILILRKRLDKHKLLNKLIELVIASHREQHINKVLNKKTVEHFRHKIAFMHLAPYFEQVSRVEIEKMKINLEDLDILLGYHKSVLENKLTLERDLQMKITTLTETVKKEIEDFEELVRNSITRSESSERHLTAIAALIQKLATTRHDVTEFRRDLILKQSQIAQLQMEFEKLEYISEGLRLSDYNVRLTETIGLSKLVEDKDHQIQVHRKRCHDALHTVTHMLENIDIERAMQDIHEEQLADTENIKQDLREILYVHKITHLKLLQLYSQIHRQGGLLGKTEIMLDYDKIVNLIPKVQQRIENLKEVHDELSKKVFNLAKICEKS